MYKIWERRKKRAGKCELCRKSDEHLERHHVRYEPEKTIMLCHNCHFTAHYYPERLRYEHQFILLRKIMSAGDSNMFIMMNGNNRVAMAKAIAPSRREAIRKD